jgi:hypothetical protein
VKRWYYDLRWKVELRWRQIRLWWHLRHRAPDQCEHPGCKAEGIPCFLPDYGREEDPFGDAVVTPDYYYCAEHAKVEGFCWGCGGFFGGLESFDFGYAYGHIKGLCENCDHQVKTDCGEYDDEDWDDPDDYDDYPDEAYAESEA